MPSNPSEIAQESPHPLRVVNLGPIPHRSKMMIAGLHALSPTAAAEPFKFDLSYPALSLGCSQREPADDAHV